MMVAGPVLLAIGLIPGMPGMLVTVGIIIAMLGIIVMLIMIADRS